MDSIIPKRAVGEQSDPYAKDGVPPLGFRNYWYPAMRASRLGRKPVRVTMLGEAIVLWREGAAVYALHDRCLHRGSRLSLGRCEFPGSGTITCPYHGWTYDGRTGQVRAALMEGPGAQFGQRTHVKAYPVEERAGLIWVFVGDMAVVPLAEDIPEWLLQPEWFAISYVVDYRCNWRALADNWAQDWHANYVHRRSPEFLFQPAPFARKMVLGELPDHKGVGYLDVGGVTEAEFPGLGRWPRSNHHRFMKPRGVATTWYDPDKDDKERAPDGSKFLKQLRLPAYILVGRGHRNYWLCQYATPLTEHTTRLFNINIFRRRSMVSELKDRVHYATFRWWAHDVIFSGQDKRILDDWEIGPERLSGTDAGVMQWRRYSVAHARQPTPGAADADKIGTMLESGD
jgi:phenylpropionate dioxygenase-like ring-hydroxylating dioxygenase large terminal subunit